jgi:hypothetical protein
LRLRIREAKERALSRDCRASFGRHDIHVRQEVAVSVVFKHGAIARQTGRIAGFNCVERGIELIDPLGVILPSAL